MRSALSKHHDRFIIRRGGGLQQHEVHRLWNYCRFQNFVSSTTPVVTCERYSARKRRHREISLLSIYNHQITGGTCSIQKPHHQQQQIRYFGGGMNTVKAPKLRSRDDEEYHASRALRFLQENQPNVIVHVENVQLSAIKLLPRLAEATIQSTPLRIKVLTHVDQLSDSALQQQILTVQQMDDRIRYPHQEPIAIFALNLQSVDGLKAKELSELRDALFGASLLVSKPSIIVCGIPNSGKSSLIYPLTRHRTVQERKKGAYHLPKVSSKAGMTLGVKKHTLPPVFGSFIKHNITLIDMPGFRPKLIYADPKLVTLLLSAGVTEPFTGYKNIATHEAIVDTLLQAVHRHTTMTNPRSLPEYVSLMNTNTKIDDPITFMKTYAEWSKTAPEDILEHITGHSRKIEQTYWPRVFHSGLFGGMIFTPYPVLPHPSHSQHIELNRDSPVVYMNEQAQRLMNIGRGLEKSFIKIQERPKLVPGRTSLNSNNDIPLDPNRKLVPVIYPPHQRTFKCLQCAHFVKLDQGGKVYGRRHGRVVDWSYDDILAYYSRMTEVFGGMFSKRTRYLMKDSLACTLAIKHKLRSRAAAYKRFNHLKDAYPVPNHLRPKRFQIDQPIPYVHFCTRKVGSCRTMTPEEVQKETSRLERYNVADHTFAIKRARGLPIHRPKSKLLVEQQRKSKIIVPPTEMKPIDVARQSFFQQDCLVTTVGPLSAVPRYDKDGNELYSKHYRRRRGTTEDK